MKRTKFIILLQAFFSMVSGYLISKMSFLGRLGINLFYSEYKVFKSWWQTALLLFVIQMLVFGTQLFIKKTKKNKIALTTSIALLCISFIGLYGTYYDFQHTFSHKLLKEKFHLGFYLFWIGWLGTCLYFLTSPSKVIALEEKSIT